MNLAQLNAVAKSAEANTHRAEILADSIRRTRAQRESDELLLPLLLNGERYINGEAKDALFQAAALFRDPILKHAELLMECKRREHAAQAAADRAILALHCPDDAKEAQR